MKKYDKKDKEEELINIPEIDNDQKPLKLIFLEREIREKEEKKKKQKLKRFLLVLRNG